MNKKIIIPIIVVVSIFSVVGFLGLTPFSLNDVVINDNDGKITSIVHGTIVNLTDIQLVELADLILLGDVKSVKLVEEKDNPTAQYNMVISYIEIKPTEILKGIPVLNEDGNVILRVPGGETENYRTEYEFLLLSKDDHVFMYLGSYEGETSTYIPTDGVGKTYVIRDNEAMNYHSELINLDDLLNKHKKLIQDLL